jgi:hypothetical protein
MVHTDLVHHSLEYIALITMSILSRSSFKISLLMASVFPNSLYLVEVYCRTSLGIQLSRSLTMNGSKQRMNKSNFSTLARVC